MGIAAGGLIKQCILEDPNPAICWDHERTIIFNVQILDANGFRQITGMDPPESPITAATYSKHGLPFYKIFDEKSSVVGDFGELKSIKQLEKAEGTKRKRPVEDEPSYKNPLVVLNPDGSRRPFRAVSELREDLQKLRSVQF